MALPSFILAAGQNPFTTATRTSDYVLSYPLGANEPTAIDVAAEYWQLANSYTRPPPTSNVSIPSPQNIANSVTAYFVDDVNFADLGAGVKSWTRLWATVPATWIEDSQYAFPYPAYSYAGGVGNSFAIANITANTASHPHLFILGTLATGIAAGDPVYIDVTYVQGGQNVHASGTIGVVSANSGANVTIGPGLLAPYASGAFTDVVGTIREALYSRITPETKVVDARIIHDYALSDSTNIANVLPTIDGFTPIVAATGAITDELATTTLPTAATWAAMIDAGTEVVAEPSTRRIYEGNIYERQTIFVKAR